MIPGLDIISIILWEVYVALSNIALKQAELNPEEFGLGLIGWALLVEVPRIIFGFVIVQQAHGLISG